jgi:hypothetical protein
LAQKVEELEYNNAQLAKKYAQAAKDSSFIGPNQKILVNQCKKAYLNKVCDAVKAKVWGVFKFLSTPPRTAPRSTPWLDGVWTLQNRALKMKRRSGSSNILP